MNKPEAEAGIQAAARQDKHKPAPAPTASPLPPDESASTRLERLESQMQAMEQRNQQLQQEQQELMGKYQSLLNRGKAPVFGADANNPDGMGVPGGLVTVESGSGTSGARSSSVDGKSSSSSKTKGGEKKSADRKDEKNDDKKEPEWYEVGSNGELKLMWKDRRLVMESANRDFRLRFEGRINWDTGFFSQTRGMPKLQDGSDFRRARLGIEGYLYENFYFRARYDFANTQVVGNNIGGGATTNFRDVFARVEKLPFLGNIQGGQWKEPISLDWQSSSNQLIFLERPAVINALNPGRNVGIGQFRTFLDDRVYWHNGIFRSATNNGGFSTGDGQWAYTARLVGLPYYYAEGRYLMHIGGSYSYRAFNGSPVGTNQPSYNTIPDLSIGTPLVLSTGSLTGIHNQNIASGEFVTVWGPLSIQAEVLSLNFHGPRNDSPNYWGWYVQASYFLTGENRRYRRTGEYGFSFTTPVPAEDFFTVNRFPWIFGRGAWEVGARYDYLDLSGGGLVVRPDSFGAGGTGRWDGMTYALNWWLNPNTTIMWEWVHGWRNSDTRGFSGQMDGLAMRLRFFF